MDDIAKIKLLQKRCDKWFERARMHRSKEKALQKTLDMRIELIESLTRRLDDKEGFITKLNLEDTELNKRILALGRAAEKQIDYWRDQFMEQAKKRPETYDWRGAYWKAQGALAARRDECQDLKAKVKRLEEEAVVALGGYDNLILMGKNQIRDLNYWRDACEKSDTTFRDLTERNKNLKVQLGDILVKNIDVSKTEKVIEDLVDECRKVKVDLGVKKDRIVFLEELAGSLYGEGWSKLTIADAQDYYTGNKYKLGVLRNRVKELEKNRDTWVDEYHIVKRKLEFEEKRSAEKSKFLEGYAEMRKKFED